MVKLSFVFYTTCTLPCTVTIYSSKALLGIINGLLALSLAVAVHV